MAAEREFDMQGELSEDCLTITLTHAHSITRLLTALVGKTLRVRFSIFRAKRSDAQNRYIWGVVVPTVRAWYLETNGEKKSEDWIYGYLRTDVIGDIFEIEELPSGKQVITMTGKRFSKMNTKEFTDAIEIIVQEMANRGCYISLPRENNFLTDHISDD